MTQGTSHWEMAAGSAKVSRRPGSWNSLHLWRLQLNQKPLKTMKMHYEICRSKIFESALRSLVGLYDLIGLFNVNDSMTFILGVRALRERESGVNTEVTPESAAVPQRHSERHSVQPQRGACFMGWRLGQQENQILLQWRGKKDFGSLPFVHRSWSGSPRGPPCWGWGVVWDLKDRGRGAGWGLAANCWGYAAALMH